MTPEIPKTWELDRDCPLCGSRLLCEEHKSMRGDAYREAICPTCGTIELEDHPGISMADYIFEMSDDDIIAHLLSWNPELAKTLVERYDDTRLAGIIDRLNRCSTDDAHIAADEILLRLVADTYPKTAQAFRNLGKWYA